MLDGDDAPHDQLVADIVQCGHGAYKAGATIQAQTSKTLLHWIARF
jgi:hypothetical protein